MMRKVRTRLVWILCLPILLSALTACDIVTAEFKSQETAEWHKSYPLGAGSRVEISNVNGKIDVQASDGHTLEVTAVKVAKGSSPEAARQALERIEIVESASPTAVRIETKVPRSGTFLNMGSSEVRYTVKVPADADVRFTTVNGGIALAGLQGRVTAETTNGGINASDVSGPIEASTTNGGIEVDVTRVLEPGVRLSCTNGGIRLRLPADAKATIAASVTNGGIQSEGLDLETTESSRRRLSGRLNGGGPSVRLEGTNGGIRIARR